MNKPIYTGKLLLLIVIMLLTAFTFTGSACHVLKHDKKAVAEKKQADSDKKFNEEYEKARKQHYKNQSKEAKAMMKQTKKKSARYNEPKKRKGSSGIKCR